MKTNIYLIFFSLIYQITTGQSITIEPNPANGIMMDIKNKPLSSGFPPIGTNYVLTVPKINILPPTPQEGMIAYYAGKLQYYNGSAWIALDSPNILPTSTIVLSETKTNTNLSNAGYALQGVANLTYNPVSYGSFAWVKAINPVNSPNRDYHCAVWTGTNMIIWGGYDGTNFLNTCKSYNPITDIWTDMATSFLTGRSTFGYAWTGSKMLIWGGYENPNFKNDGAVFDPVSNTWSTLATSNAPTGRSNFPSVWTGDKMIIWGGNTSLYTVAGDGKIYNPANNTWLNMSALNAPAERSYHTAVWTGSKMIVWGGNNAGGYPLNTGAIYDVASDTWTTMTTTGGPPTGLKHHTAVWTGTKMIVFGGRNDNVITNQCYLYDPSTDTWSSASTVNIVSPRLYHASVWINGKMIVFGGYDGTNLNDGGIYDPSTNTWSTDKIILPNLSYINHTLLNVNNDAIVFGQNGGYLLKADFQSAESKLMYFFQKN